MLMQRRRSLFIIAGMVLAVVVAFFISGTLNAPESIPETSGFSDGQYVELAGELVCLPHRDQSGPQTMECAFGFKDESGTYYALQDTTQDYSLLSGVPMNQRIQIGGVYQSSDDDKYQQNGMIKLEKVIE